MYPIIEIIQHFEGSDFNFLIDIFSNIIPFLKLLDEDYIDFKTKFEATLTVQKKFPYHPLHSLFEDLLLKSVITDAVKVYDGIRDVFLYKISLFSPDCLASCPDEHGCCHSSYSTNKLDYLRIQAENLLDPSHFIVKKDSYKLKIKVQNGVKICSALELPSKRCLIHKYKPSTCCKYPLVINTRWDDELACWVNKCAHSIEAKSWGTKVSPLIIEALRTLWVKSYLMWEAEYDIKKNYPDLFENEELYKILKDILSIRKCLYIINREETLALLEKNYKRADILKVFNIVKTLN